ncbi:Rab proteins geranylgeranyltransferase component A [Arachnomyces sp. PD_36]|nr:Rab proteins geranylgeranyltransferase component A [Arachnomyces sp. PD_36]
MDTLNDTEWDVLISGTGLPQSLLALALSRSGKKILHVDKNDYYGGSEAAFSLDEAEAWMKKNNQEPGQVPFENISLFKSSETEDSAGKLSASRAYTLSLAPQLIYTRSQLIPSLVSSKVYKQLDFLAVGSWWIWRTTEGGEKDGNTNLQRVPGGREDVFDDDNIDSKSKRLLMKFLRYLTQVYDPTSEAASGEEFDLPFSEYLATKFQMPVELCDPLVSLSLSPNSSEETTARYALPRIQTHLASIGVFGPGFGSVLAKWGGGAEISQVGCRACAVGGGVYVLKRGVDGIDFDADDTPLRVRLSDGESVRAKMIVGSPWDLPEGFHKGRSSVQNSARSISVVSSSLERLFVQMAEGGPTPGGVVVNLPAGTLGQGSPPVYLMIHSSDTGECPTGQCVIYGSTSVSGEEGEGFIRAGVERVLSAEGGGKVLWCLSYTQLGVWGDEVGDIEEYVGGKVVGFPAGRLDLGFADGMLGEVRSVWKRVVGDEEGEEGFMVFAERNEEVDDDE